jgi:ABC-type transport system involved in cytochrome c biogenesis ATPase subunit
LSTVAPVSERLVGVTLFGPAPLGRVDVPLWPGVLALYGLNGVGKTRLLRACSDALRGIAGHDQRGFLHWEVSSSLDWGSPWRKALDEQTRAHLMTARGSRLDELLDLKDLEFLESDVDDAYQRFGAYVAGLQEEEFSPHLLNEVVEAHLRLAARRSDELDEDWYDEEGRAVLREVADGGRLVLEASGSPERPRWIVHAAGDCSAPAFGPLFRQDALSYRQLHKFRDSFVAADLHTEEAMQRMLETAGSMTNLPWGDKPAAARLFIDAAAHEPGTVDIWPDWVTIPLSPIAEVDCLPIVLVDEGHLDLDELTRKGMLSACGGHVVEAVADEEVVFTSAFQQEVTNVVEAANSHLAKVLPNPPSLLFAHGGPNDWFAGAAPSWQGATATAQQPIPLAALSAAQQRWAALSIALAVTQRSAGDHPLVFLCDEPEAGLHRLAEDALPHGLAELSKQTGASIAVATHSAAMLNAFEVEKFHVTQNDSGTSTVKPLSADLSTAFRDAIARSKLGLAPADVLQMIRVFVIVEGEHDRRVLEHLLHDDLRSAGAVVLSAGGAKTLPSIATASLIWDYTDADVVVVLDNLAADVVQPIWKEAIGEAQSGNTRQAQRILQTLEKMPGGEPKWLRELLSKAIVDQKFARLHPSPLAMPDIVCYLPPSSLGLSGGWDELIAQWRSSYRERAPVDLKKWLGEHRGRRISLRDVERGVKEAVVTRELQDLGLRIQEISGTRAFNQ